MIKKIKIGLIQSKSLGTIRSNIDLAIKNIKKAANKKAKIICLPELFLTNYFCQTESHSNFKLAEKIPADRFVITESGIHTRADVQRMMEHNIFGFLSENRSWLLKAQGKNLKKLCLENIVNLNKFPDHFFNIY